MWPSSGTQSKEYNEVHKTVEPEPNKQIHKTKIKQKKNIVATQNHTKENTHQQNTWITFTYFLHETQQIAKIFKETDSRIAFRTINTMQKHLQPKQ